MRAAREPKKPRKPRELPGYRFREDRSWPYVLNVSGGRTSAYMLRQILDAYGGQLPEDVIPVFTNTGREKPQTLDFLREIETRWRVPLVWLEYVFDPAGAGPKRIKHGYRIVDYARADRSGGPFGQLVRIKRFLPSRGRRTCTTELKVRTVDRYMRRELGIRHYQNVLGFRHDEPRRVRKCLDDDRCNSEFPLFDNEVTGADVAEYWRQAEFDLQLGPDQGNCDLCFLKGRRKLLGLIRADPGLADWWIEREDAQRALGGSIETFRDGGESYRDLVALAASEATLFDDAGDPGKQGDPGEQGLPCFCTD